MTLAQPVRLAVLALGMAAAGGALAADGSPAPEDRPFPRGLVELKRQNTSRGTPDETTKTNLKFDWFPAGSAVSLLRLELPFPDAKSDFSGSPFDPDFGDAKIRVGFAAKEFGSRPVTSFVEVTFPTAHPESQGTGKYQFSAGVRTAFQLWRGADWLGAPAHAFAVQAQQVASFAGDASRKDINQTKFELEWRSAWTGGHYGKATAKPVVDWVGDGRTGAVLELEGGWAVDRQWTLVLMAGGLLWGQGVPSTYDTRVELKAVYRY